MAIEDALHRLGLSRGEAKVYLALLRRGPLPVRVIKETTGLHRTTIYDFLEKLLQKGLASSVRRGGVRQFQAAAPERLLDRAQEQSEAAAAVVPALKRAAAPAQDLSVEVYAGVEGLKAILNDVHRVGEDYVLFGVDESLFKERLPRFMEQFLARERRLRIHERVLTRDDARFIYRRPSVRYRCIPKEFFNPTATMVWGDRVAIITWEPLAIVRIQNAPLADSYRKHFELLWRQARPLPKK